MFNAAPWQLEALTTPINHFALLTGIACGKTCTGAHFVIKNMIENPHYTGLIGANTYDQLSQATLRELFYWLEKYQIPFVIDRRPPWKVDQVFKDWHNILSVKIGKQTAHAFTRVMSFADPLRGLNISWAWLDETRDTPQNTHDIVLSRMRETKGFAKSLITSTTAGEDWAYHRFVKNGDKKSFGFCKAKTAQAVDFGIITKEFYSILRQSYSPQLAAQELDAEFVHNRIGRCYYTFDADNYQYDYEPDYDLPLILACDFNFSPAPLVWEVGQQVSDNIIWFDEFSEVECSTERMAAKFAAKYQHFFVKIFGDASGTRGTSSNKGITDFQQIANVLNENGIPFSIDVPNQNPSVRERIENVCRLGRNAENEIQMTYNPERCPLLHEDLTKLCFKNDKPYAAEVTLTHASDAIGYAAYRIMPPLRFNAAFGNNVARKDYTT